MREFELTCPLGRDLRYDDIRAAAAEILHLRPKDVINVVDPTRPYQPQMLGAIAQCNIVHRSIDARGDVKWRYKIEAWFLPKERPVERELAPYQDVSSAENVIVIGSGPAGLFAALKLMTLGLKPVILERGKDVKGRKIDIARLNREGISNPESNYCYGEGGAGTFSDGKLYTRSTKRGDNRDVLDRFVSFGADPSIIVDAHPHIGTDKLPRLIQNIRECILEHGGEYHFSSRVYDINPLKSGVINVKVEDSSSDKPQKIVYKAKAVILACGHSATDMYQLFVDKGWALEAKGFALGVRAEHPQALINRMRYRGQWESGMPAAEYSFSEQVGLSDEGGDERGVFSFCMCPGGILVPSSTEPDGLVLNGMSNSARNSQWANAGVVVQLNPEDVPQEYEKFGPLKALEYQRDIEKTMREWVRLAAPEASAAAAPAQRMVDFCEGVQSADLPKTSYKPGVVSAPLHELLPEGIAKRLQKAFKKLGDTPGMRGYYTNDALLLGVESRTSSPVRMLRDGESLQSISVSGLFPCGEGAGYSGGIVSSAVDGYRCAQAVADYLGVGAASHAADEERAETTN